MRILVIVLAAILTSASVSQAQITQPGTNAAESTNRFSSEADAKAHCASDVVVWMNLRSHVYHYAGTRDYGHTRQGAFMCRAEANNAGRAAKNEHAPSR